MPWKPPHGQIEVNQLQLFLFLEKRSLCSFLYFLVNFFSSRVVSKGASVLVKENNFICFSLSPTIRG